MGFMKYSVEMGLGAMIYIRSFIKINAGIQTLIGEKGGIHTHKNRQHCDVISLSFTFSKQVF
jgi:hypothetical protein